MFVCLSDLGFYAECGIAKYHTEIVKLFLVMHVHPDTPSSSDFLKPCQVMVSDYSFVMPVTFIFIYHLNVKFHAFYCLPFLCTIMLT